MTLDRQSIEKKDFPIGRRGYAPDAVDAHLRTLADEIEALNRSGRRRSEPLSAAASEQVRSIVEAAETTAADIQRQAEDEARKIRGDASCEADATREQATADVRNYVGRVARSTTGMLERIDAMENELGVLIESLRSGSNRLKADLQLLEDNLASVKNEVVPRPRSEPEHAAAAAAKDGAAAPASSVEQAAPASSVDQAAPAVPTAEPFAESVGVEGAAAHQGLTGASADPASAEPAPAQGANGTEDESARLIALNMVMNNTPREEIERYLAEHFRLTDRCGLLDDVYSSFET